MSVRSASVTFVAGLALALGVSACGAKPTTAQRSLAMIHVRMFHRIGQLDETWPSGTDSIGAYFGPTMEDRELAEIITGPGVNVLLLAKARGLDPGTVLIGRGTAPLGCRMDLERFAGSARPLSWFDASRSQLKRVRLREADIVLVTAVCGGG